jgi:hypothetical protein
VTTKWLVEKAFSVWGYGLCAWDQTWVARFDKMATTAILDDEQSESPEGWRPGRPTSILSPRPISHLEKLAKTLKSQEKFKFARRSKDAPGAVGAEVL